MPTFGHHHNSTATTPRLAFPSWPLDQPQLECRDRLEHYRFFLNMSYRPAARICHGALRSSNRSSLSSIARINRSRRLYVPTSLETSSRVSITLQSRQFHASTPALKGILPETDNPPKRKPEEHEPPASKAEISIEDYHKVADHYLEGVIAKFEQRQEEKADLEIEYSVCHVTATTLPFASTANLTAGWSRNN
jgi:hypothetical protein